jgi:hypothetical protein
MAVHMKIFAGTLNHASLPLKSTFSSTATTPLLICVQNSTYRETKMPSVQVAYRNKHKTLNDPSIMGRRNKKKCLNLMCHLQTCILEYHIKMAPSPDPDSSIWW